MSLTKLAIERMVYSKTGSSADYRWDDQLRGFGVRIYPSGLKAYILAYRSPTGTKRFFTLGRHGELTVQQARNLAQQQLARVRAGHDPQMERHARRSEMTFAEMARRYLEHVTAREKRSIASDHQRLRDHLLPQLGSQKLSELTLRNLQQLQERIASKTSNATANRCAALVKHMLNVAVDWQLLPASPARSLKMLKEPPPRDIVLTPAQCRVLLDACDSDNNVYAAALFKLAMLTGRRVGELLNLRWPDVDLDNNRLVIHQTKAGERQYVYMNEAAADVLRCLPRVEGNDFVIAGLRGGRPLNFYRRAWDRILRRAGLEPFPPHGLRHNYASMMVAAGIPLEVVGHLLGHKSSLTTRKYAHHRPEHLHKAADTLPKVIDLKQERVRRNAS